MPYTEYSPHPALSHCIECFWHYRRNETQINNNLIIPDNCSDILINLSQQGKINLYFIGTMTRPILSIQRELIGIRFKPGYAYAFFGIPMNEFADIMVGLNDFWDNTGELEQEIYSNENIHQRIIYIQNFLILYKNKFLPVDERLSHVLQSISADTGYNSIENLSSELNLSRQHLRRIFLKYIGINPVEFMRISRILKTINHIEKQNCPDMCSIAQDFGYYDQSHMIMDFRKFTGSSPSEYFSKK